MKHALSAEDEQFIRVIVPLLLAICAAALLTPAVTTLLWLKEGKLFSGRWIRKSEEPGAYWGSFFCFVVIMGPVGLACIAEAINFAFFFPLG
jgi:hypothetical protein